MKRILMGALKATAVMMAVKLATKLFRRGEQRTMEHSGESSTA